ncbi:MAG: hypothetical protein KIT68_06200 [Phycisphaeraceae bacterium]|nr:hypothetical protein [Phycisphaeraceae bacterium]
MGVIVRLPVGDESARQGFCGSLEPGGGAGGRISGASTFDPGITGRGGSITGAMSLLPGITSTGLAGSSIRIDFEPGITRGGASGPFAAVGAGCSDWLRITR